MLPSTVKSNIIINNRAVYIKNETVINKRINQLKLPTMVSSARADSSKISFLAKMKSGKMSLQPLPNVVFNNSIYLSSLQHSSTGTNFYKTKERGVPILTPSKINELNANNQTFLTSVKYNTKRRSLESSTSLKGNLSAPPENNDSMITKITNIGAMKLPLFDKLLLYQFSKQEEGISKNKMGTTLKSFNKIKNKVAKKHTIPIEKRDTFFIFSSSMPNFNNKSQENRYYETQKELHALRIALAGCKSYNEEYAEANNCIIKHTNKEASGAIIKDFIDFIKSDEKCRAIHTITECINYLDGNISSVFASPSIRNPPRLLMGRNSMPTNSPKSRYNSKNELSKTLV